ncbi:PREDICTED: probable 28S ribosomal protein S16, mitochondrial [Rhagoletis zephyria]|uniref:probable 28S ribosomal protein S16, mitochondrial n=1 Tax=Rhagoletis zephyria TaxID=28612 RepID=UPI0008118929|nr:PREDICTED: probable 28S ribosomal protein S16, mitochondrial [Rhagoletis zephyria]KAH9392817.1 37S ribosomal protein S16, mitochondrial [Tyrophagus putrescentiae]
MVWPHKAGFGIKLVRMGCKNRPYYQIGAMPSRRRTGLLPDEVIGSLDPIPNERNEIVAAVDLSRLSYWQGRGGRLSVGMETLLGLAGWTPVPPHVYLKAKEERDKEATAKSREGEGKEDEEPQVERVLPKKLPF